MSAETPVSELSGEQLREAVALEVMHFERYSFPDWPDRYGLFPAEDVRDSGLLQPRDDARLAPSGLVFVPCFESDGAAMLQIISHMRDSGFSFKVDETLRDDWPTQAEPILYRVGFFSLESGVCGFGVELPEAVARAALIAVRAERAAQIA